MEKTLELIKLSDMIGIAPCEYIEKVNELFDLNIDLKLGNIITSANQLMVLKELVLRSVSLKISFDNVLAYNSIQAMKKLNLELLVKFEKQSNLQRKIDNVNRLIAKNEDMKALKQMHYMFISMLSA